MTSGVFQSLPIDSILINRTERQRKELVEIPELAASIKRVGLIHPILITREDSILIAGERRIEACRFLGWTHINVQFEDQIDPLELKALEYEENIRRIDLPWPEEVAAVKEYHEFKTKTDPAWTQEKTAEALGITRREVGEKIEVAKEIKANPKVAAIDKFSTARGLVRRSAERKAAIESAEIDALIEAPKEVKPEIILNISFNEWAPQYEGPKFNLIHCDFPYGINANKMQQGNSVTEFGAYSDSEDIYWQLLETFAKNLDNFCADQAHLMFWYSMKFHTRTIEFLRTRTNFIVDDFPLIWTKDQGLLPDPQRGPRRTYETALFASRGDRKIVRAVSNSIAASIGERIHMSQKPVEVLNHFFGMLVDKSTTLLDPTCGSATALVAAHAKGAQRVLGLEINPEFVQRSRLAVEAAMKEEINGED